MNSDLEAGAGRSACLLAIRSGIFDFLHSLDQKLNLSRSFLLTVPDVLPVQSNILVFVLWDTCSNKALSLRYLGWT